MDRIWEEAIWLCCRDFSDVVLGRKPASEVGGCHEVGKVCSQLVAVVEAIEGRLPVRAVHAFDLARQTSRMVGLGQAVLDHICCTDHVEQHLP